MKIDLFVHGRKNLLGWMYVVYTPNRSNSRRCGDGLSALLATE